MELVLAPMAIQGVKYKPEDFRLVAQFATTTTILAVRNSLNIKTVDELLAYARRNADKPLTYGSVGPGSLYHLIGEKFSQLTKVQTLHVPYRGIAPLLTDLMGGQIDMAFLPMAGSIPATLMDGRCTATRPTTSSMRSTRPSMPRPKCLKPARRSRAAATWSCLHAHPPSWPAFTRAKSSVTARSPGRSTCSPSKPWPKESP